MCDGEYNQTFAIFIDLFDGADEVASNGLWSCARKDGQVSCAGSNGSCQLSSFPADVLCDPTALEGHPLEITSIDVPYDTSTARSTCVVAGGAASCRGDLGWPPYQECSAFEAMPGLEAGTVELDRRTYVLCALGTNGTVVCEGSNSGGELGLSNTSEQDGLVTAEVSDVVELDLGADYALARRADGTVRCWGDRDTFQYFLCLTPNPTAPRELDLGQPALEVSAGGSHACAVLADRTLVCWGSNWRSAVSSSSQDTLPLTPILLDGQPFRVPASKPAGFKRVVAGESQTCAVHESGQVYCWGDNQFYGGFTPYGKLGTGSSTSEVSEPSLVALPCAP
jgi:hypothetical protein